MPVYKCCNCGNDSHNLYYKALRFNPLDKSLEFVECESDFIIRDEFYIHTSDSKYCLAGEIWKDTPKNREIIENIIKAKVELAKAKDLHSKYIHAQMNGKEK